MSTSNRSYPARDIKLLWALSAGRCAYPGCRLPCIARPNVADDDLAIVGDIAHVYPHSPGGPRGEEDAPRNLNRDSYNNWVLLCATHHRLVEAQSHAHSAEWLSRAKMSHERWIDERLSGGEPHVTHRLPAAVTIDRQYRVFRAQYSPLQAALHVPPLGRFDDPFGEFSVLYAASSADTARRHALAPFRASSTLLGETVPGEDSLTIGDALALEWGRSATTEDPYGYVPREWFEQRKLAEIQASELKLFQLDQKGGLLAQQAIRPQLGEFADVSPGLTKNLRVSQAAARWVYDLQDTVGSPAFDGIMWPSSLDLSGAVVAPYPRAVQASVVQSD